MKIRLGADLQLACTKYIPEGTFFTVWQFFFFLGGGGGGRSDLPDEVRRRVFASCGNGGKKCLISFTIFFGCCFCFLFFFSWRNNLIRSESPGCDWRGGWGEIEKAGYALQKPMCYYFAGYGVTESM